MTNSAASILAQLEENHRDLERMLDAALAAETRRPQLAAALAQAAAEFAWGNHTGWFSYAPLEQLVARLGRSLPELPTRGGRAPRTLHVVTQLYQTGGHTQTVVSWTDELAHRSHEIVATRQRTVPMPAKVLDRLSDRVGLTRLDTRPGDLLQRAARLRALASTADLVISHCHPYDVVPALAFADRRGLPPVVYLDNTDHVFWLGTAAYDHIMHLRYSGQELAQRRRGVAPGRSLVRNRPLVVRRRYTPRDQAKRDWDVPLDAVLMVTAADGSKFRGADGPDLATMVEPVVQAEPRLQWRVAGPDPDTEPWRSLSLRTGGRARAVGKLPDVSGLHQAADLYLDSFPFAGLTSLLEAGAFENPIVTFRGHPAECGVWGSDSPGIDELMFRPDTAAALHQTLALLVHDEELRVERGRATARAIVSSHTGPGWAEQAESLYALPANLVGDPAPPVRDHNALDLLTASVQATNPHRRAPVEAVAGMLGALPAGARVRAWRDARAQGAGRARDLAPEWLLATLKSRLR